MAGRSDRIGRCLILWGITALLCRGGSAVRVQRATMADILPASRIMRAVFAADITSTFSSYNAERIFAEGLEQRLPLVWVARADDEAVLGVCECEVLGGKLWHMSGLCVLPTARRRGVGQALVSAVQRDASAERRALYLHVEAENTPARELYTRCGFELVDQGLHADERELLFRRTARSADPTAPLEVLFGVRAAPPPDEEQRGGWRPVVKAKAGRRK